MIYDGYRGKFERGDIVALKVVTVVETERVDGDDLCGLRAGFTVSS